MLDVGAGRGRFVVAARAAGYAAEGIEPSARGVAGARESYGIDLRRAGIASAGTTSVDVLSLWHVLEHIEDPGARTTPTTCSSAPPRSPRTCS